jgi:hypothetical protein
MTRYMARFPTNADVERKELEEWRKNIGVDTGEWKSLLEGALAVLARIDGHLSEADDIATRAGSRCRRIPSANRTGLIPPTRSHRRWRRYPPRKGFYWSTWARPSLWTVMPPLWRNTWTG